MYRINTDSMGMPAYHQGFYTAMKDNGDIIRTNNRVALVQIVAMLNKEPIAYVIGPQDKLNQIDRHTKHDDSCDFYESLTDISVMPGEGISALYLVPLN